MSEEAAVPSTRPYLIRALHEWCMDHGYTPFLAVKVDHRVKVPMEYVKDGEIVLNVSPTATGNLQLGNDEVRFKARFGGVAREIAVPVGHVIAIYARENGQGMSFPPPTAADDAGRSGATASARGSGLRLAAQGGHAVPEEEAKPAPAPHPSDDGVEDLPPPPPDEPPPRPTLKRVK